MAELVERPSVDPDDSDAVVRRANWEQAVGRPQTKALERADVKPECRDGKRTKGDQRNSESSDPLTPL